MTQFSDTICAPASGKGGAISIIRISGPEALGTTDRIFESPSRKKLSESAAYSMHYGIVRAPEGETVDEVMVAVYRAPHSYTGEDSAEIFCHASQYIVERILTLLIDAGARMALPGEFTRRAFLNGKMDLAQAEAVADVIAASSAASLRVAQNQLRGGYSDRLKELRNQLLDLSVLLELELDFSEEDVEFADRSRLISLTEEALAKVSRLADSFRVGNALRNGVPVAIVGAPNSGKSTLLNALLGENRAIVSDIAGTTRDTVEEMMTIDGIQYRFIDTAGIREASDSIERQGVERSKDAIRKADVVIWVRTVEEGSEDTLKLQLQPHQTLIEVWNKADLRQENGRSDGRVTPQGENETFAGCGEQRQAEENKASAAGIESAEKPSSTDSHRGRTLHISALKGTGLEELRRRISQSQKGRIDEAGSTIVTNLRHYEALVSARESLTALLRGLHEGIPTDLSAEDLRSAIASLGSIWGEGGISAGETLERLFERHCIGK